MGRTESLGNDSFRDSTTHRSISSADNSKVGNRNNPISTIGFMMNMGYPPPPMHLDPLRRLVEDATDGSRVAINRTDDFGVELDPNKTQTITRELLRSPFVNAPCVLFVIQQRLHSSRPDRIRLALDLTEQCVKLGGLDMAQHLNKEFLRSMTSILKTNSFKDRTVTGQIKKLEKFLVGSTSNSGVSTDRRVHYLKQQVLRLIQLWADSFMMEELRVPHIHETYRSLRKKGFTFPPRGQKLESPPRTADARSDLLPVTDKQILQLQKAVYLVETSDDVDLIKRCVDIFVRMTPKVERRVQILSQEGHQEPYGEVKLKTLLELNDKLQSAIVKRDAGEFEKPAKPVVNDLLDMGPSPTGPAAVTPQTSMSLTPSIRPSEDPFADLMSCFDTQPESVKAVDAPTVPREEAETVSDAMSAPSLTPAVWSGDFPKASSVDMDPEQVDPVAESFNHGVLSSSDEEEQLAAWLKDNQHLKPLEKPRRATGSDEDDFRSIPESDTDSSQRHRVAALSEDPFGGDIDWSKLDAEMEDALV